MGYKITYRDKFQGSAIEVTIRVPADVAKEPDLWRRLQNALGAAYTEMFDAVKNTRGWRARQ